MLTLDLKAIFDDDRQPGAPLASVATARDTPVDPFGGLTPDRLPEPWRELWVERAAIREFDGGQAREHAEAEALRETIAAMRAVESDNGY